MFHLPQIQGLRLLGQSPLIIITTALGKQLIYLLMHQRYAYNWVCRNSQFFFSFTMYCIILVRIEWVFFWLLFISTLGFEKEGEGTAIQGGRFEKKRTGIQWDFQFLHHLTMNVRKLTWFFFYKLSIQMQEVRRKEEAAARGKLHTCSYICWEWFSCLFGYLSLLYSIVYIAITA